MVKVELTNDEVERVLKAQRAEIAALKLRLVQAHVTMKYLQKVKLKVTSTQLKAVISHLETMLDDDNEQADRTGYSDINHGVVQEQIDKYEQLLAEAGVNGVRLPALGFLYQFIANGYDEMQARNCENYVDSLMTRSLWRPGEPETPTHFSSPGLAMP